MRKYKAGDMLSITQLNKRSSSVGRLCSQRDAGGSSVKMTNNLVRKTNDVNIKFPVTPANECLATASAMLSVQHAYRSRQINFKK